MSPTPNAYQHDDDEIDISELLSHLWVNKWLIATVTAICLSLGGIYVYLQVPQYQSDVLVQVDENQGGGSSLLGGDGFASLGFSSGGNAAAVETALIKSRFILTPVVKNLGLDIHISPQRTFWQRLFGSEKNTKATITNLRVPKTEVNQPLTLINDAKNHIQLYDQNKHLLLQGSIGKELTSEDKRYHLTIENIEAPIGAAFTVKKLTVAEVVELLITRLQINSMGEKRQKDTGLLEISLKGNDPQQVVATLNEVAKIAKDKNAEKKSLEAASTLSFLKQQLPLTQKLLTKAEFKLNQYRAQSGKIDIEMQTKMLIEQLASYDTELAKLNMQKIDMTEQYTAAHPAYIALNRQINEITERRQQLEKNIKSLPASDQIALALIRDVKVKTTLYTSILNRIQELEVIKAGMVSDVRILSKADVPNSPLPGKKSLIYMASMLLGIMISVGIIFGRKLLFPHVQDPQWTEKHFNIPTLAIIPHSKEQDGKTTLLARDNPKNLSIEALRSLRTSLQVNMSFAGNNILTILGISPGVGKTFMSVNLAYLLATAGKRVLLIDADLRRGTAHKYFHLPPSPGFAELIQEDCALEDILKPTSHENLTILPRGDYPKDPAELLSSTACKKLIETFSKQYDIVLFDTAPALLVTDAMLISGFAATNYLVLGSNTHRPQEIEMTVKRLKSANVPITGSVFNFQNVAEQHNVYHYKYYHYNYYYDDHDTKKREKSKPSLAKV